MGRPASLSNDPNVRWTFLANTYATGWLWYPRGVGFLYCTDGLLQFEPAGTIPFHRPVPFQHTQQRVLLLTPWGIPNHFSVVVFAGGEVSVSIPRNRGRLRLVLAECGFDVVEAPPQRMYPFNQRKVWERHMGPRVLSRQLPEGTVLGGVDKPVVITVLCPACEQPVQLDYEDVQRRWYAANGSAHATEPAAAAFAAARPLVGEETALDSSCPSCARPMRVIVRGDEWRMTLWRYFVTEVLVLAPSS